MKALNGTNGKLINSQAAMDKAVKKICDILRRDKAKGARLYVSELTWIFFLRYLDVIDEKAEAEAKALKVEFEPTLEAPYRWRDWAAAYDRRKDPKEVIKSKERGWKRCEIDNYGWNSPVIKDGKQEIGSYIDFINKELFPYLKGLKDIPAASNKQKIVSLVFINKDDTVVKSVANMQDVLDGIESITNAEINDRHMFPISQAFEGLLPRLGEKKNDGGQFFTPREVIRLIVEVLKPQVGKTVYDPCCGTGGFLIEAYKYMCKQIPTATQLKELKTESLWGREDADEAIPVVLANMVLHNVDLPRIWHGNTLTDAVTFGELFFGAPNQFDCVMTNPPFGSKESKSAQAKFAYKTGKAQVLFLQHIIDSLKDGGTCGMVIDEGVLFHTNTIAYVQTKRKLLNECNLYCIVSLPGGVFVNAGAGVKTDLFFFTKSKSTEKVWYYDMTLADDFRPRKVNKGNPLTFEAFSDFLRRLALAEDHPERISERSWYRTKAEIEASNYDLKAVNNNAPDFSDKRTPEQLLAIIRESQEEIIKSLAALEKA
jgi:type I restriction enzyme M protein